MRTLRRHLRSALHSPAGLRGESNQPPIVPVDAVVCCCGECSCILFWYSPSWRCLSAYRCGLIDPASQRRPHFDTPSERTSTSNSSTDLGQRRCELGNTGLSSIIWLPNKIAARRCLRSASTLRFGAGDVMQPEATQRILTLLHRAH